MQYYIMGVFLFVILIAVFAVQNAGPVSIKFLFWTVPGIPLCWSFSGPLFVDCDRGSAGPLNKKRGRKDFPLSNSKEK